MAEDVDVGHDATSRLVTSGGAVKVHKMLHARIFMIGKKVAIISSADLKSDSLDINYEAGIWTNNSTVIDDAFDFFEKVWEEANPWSG